MTGEGWIEEKDEKWFDGGTQDKRVQISHQRPVLKRLLQCIVGAAVLPCRLFALA